MAYQWYPGHMAKAVRTIQEDIKLIDLVIELADARIPAASRNPDIRALIGGKAHVLLLNKADLADPAISKEWLSYYKGKKQIALLCDARDNHLQKGITPRLREACAEKIARLKKKGITGRPMRALVAGIPNVGKSTFINAFAGRAIAKTGDRPGVTKGKQWIRFSREFELLDTPGLLPPKLADARVGENLALIGAIRDEIMDVEELAVLLIGKLRSIAPTVLKERYGIHGGEDASVVLEDIALSRGCLMAGGAPDTKKASSLLVREFRAGKLGRVTLERP